MTPGPEVSGCLTASTRILRAKDGAEVACGELVETGERPLVWSLDEGRRMVPRPMTNAFLLEPNRCGAHRTGRSV